MKVEKIDLYGFDLFSDEDDEDSFVAESTKEETEAVKEYDSICGVEVEYGYELVPETPFEAYQLISYHRGRCGNARSSIVLVGDDGVRYEFLTATDVDMFINQVYDCSGYHYTKKRGLFNLKKGRGFMGTEFTLSTT